MVGCAVSKYPFKYINRASHVSTAHPHRRARGFSKAVSSSIIPRQSCVLWVMALSACAMRCAFRTMIVRYYYYYYYH